jgi:hypothetical protein
MAKRPLKSFNVQVVGNQVEVDMETDRQKPYQYVIFSDTVHPDVHEIARHLNADLIQALATFDKVEVVEFLERNYVSIGVPIKYHSDRYTARKR